MLTTESHWMGGVLIRDGDENDMQRAIVSGLLRKKFQELGKPNKKIIVWGRHPWEGGCYQAKK